LSSHIRRFWRFLGRNETAKGLFLVAIVLLTAIGVWGAIRFALNTEYPVLVVSSGSMVPTLEVGALIVIKGEDPRNIQAGLPCGEPTGPSGPGSIIVFRPIPSTPDYLVVHRVRENLTLSGEIAFKTQGDHNSGCDTQWGVAIPASRVVGVYQYTIPIPGLGSAILAVRGFMYDENTGQPKPQGIAVIVALIVALFAFEVIEPSKKKQPSPPASPPTPTVQPTPEKQPGPDGSQASSVT